MAIDGSDIRSFEITVTVTQQTLTDLKRIQSLLAQKQKPATLSDAVAASAPYYLEKEDPVKRAERHANRPKSQQKELCVHRVTIKNPTAAQKHAVNNRTKGRCTFKDEKGHRCNSDRWVDIHHIKPRSEGGTNDPENLTTLCSFHHDLVHQLSMPIEGQITWLR